MLRMLLDRLLVVALAVAIGVSVAHHFKPTAQPLLVQADYQKCVTIRNEPLTRSRTLDPKQTKDVA